MCPNQEGALPHNLGMRNGDMLTYLDKWGALFIQSLSSTIGQGPRSLAGSIPFSFLIIDYLQIQSGNIIFSTIFSLFSISLVISSLYYLPLT